MFQRLVRTIQNRYHPLHRLRRHRLFLDVVMPLLDFEVGSKLYGIDWSVQLRLVRHLSWILNSREREPGITSLFLAMSKVLRPRVLWDVGACIGFYSWLLMSRDKELKAVLFEPDPDNARLITSTIHRQHLEGAHLLNSAVSDISGRAPFACDKAAGATGTLELETTFQERWHDTKPAVIEVEVLTLNQALEQFALPIPDLIKIDVEMSEKKVLDGGKALISEHLPTLVIECYGSEKQNIVSWLETLGYHLFDADSGADSSMYATNILALPNRYRMLEDELISVWQEERRCLAGDK